MIRKAADRKVINGRRQRGVMKQCQFLSILTQFRRKGNRFCLQQICQPGRAVRGCNGCLHFGSPLHGLVKINGDGLIIRDHGALNGGGCRIHDDCTGSGLDLPCHSGDVGHAFFFRRNHSILIHGSCRFIVTDPADGLILQLITLAVRHYSSKSLRIFTLLRAGKEQFRSVNLHLRYLRSRIL